MLHPEEKSQASEPPSEMGAHGRRRDAHGLGGIGGREATPVDEPDRGLLRCGQRGERNHESRFDVGDRGVTRPRQEP
jgi:hypothetical protein